MSFEVFRGTVQAVNIGPTAVYSIAILLANVDFNGSVLGHIYLRVYQTNPEALVRGLP